MSQAPQTAVTIRRATVADAAVIADLGARTFSETFAADNDPEDMAAYLAASFGAEKQAGELADPRSTFFVAEVGGRPAGYAQIRAAEAPACVTGEEPVELARLYALREWLGRGVGEALMRACVDEAQTRGHRAMWLGVWERNARAQAFYRKWGFREVGDQIFQLGSDPQRDLVMERSLEKSDPRTHTKRHEPEPPNRS
jgi:GNAT superfamily N-acetyltransferase